MSSLFVSRSATINAPASEIFALLATPARHVEIDGSGTVRQAQQNGPQRLSLGAKFGMSMKWGVPYKITNEVVEFVENSVIAWRHFGQHVWRYELQPSADGTSTVVTETFDGTKGRVPLLLHLIRAPQRNVQAIEQTLSKLQTRFGRSRVTGGLKR